MNCIRSAIIRFLPIERQKPTRQRNPAQLVNPLQSHGIGNRTKAPEIRHSAQKLGSIKGGETALMTDLHSRVVIQIVYNYKIRMEQDRHP
jgi:hypothetical protein